MKLVGIGIDLIDLEHFGRHYGEDDTELLARCFTEQELSDVGSGIDRVARLAARYAAKEAVTKALGGLDETALTDIETQIGEDGGPKIILHRQAKILAAARRISELQVSLTHSSTSAAAFVVAMGGE
jgi:holo-[acyl-carrier protein] synthase